MAKRSERTEIVRCLWAKTDLYVQYHDEEWGVPVHDDRLLFEFLILDYGEESVSVAIEEVKPEDWAEKVYKPDIVDKPDKLFKKPGYDLSELP